MLPTRPGAPGGGNRTIDGVRVKLVQLWAVAATAGVVLASPAGGQRSSLAMLDQLAPGRWEVRLRDASRRTYPICIDTGRKFIQLRHEALTCDRLVVDDRPDLVTVQYTCRGRGYGRTTIRRETSRLVQIETQGIADGLPFEFAAEARHAGTCSN